MARPSPAERAVVFVYLLLFLAWFLRTFYLEFYR